MSLTPSELRYVKALVAARGHSTDAAEIAGVHRSTFSHAMRLLATQEGLPYPDKRGASDDARDERLLFAQTILARHGDKTHDGRSKTRSPRPKPTIVNPAICHRDRESYQRRQCRECYTEAMERSLAKLTAPVTAMTVRDPDLEAEEDSALEDLIKLRRGLEKALPIAREIVMLAEQIENLLEAQS